MGAPKLDESEFSLQVAIKRIRFDAVKSFFNGGIEKP